MDFHNLHQVSLVLSEAGLASDAAFTVKEHFSTTPGLNTLPEVVYYIHIFANILLVLFAYVATLYSYRGPWVRVEWC